MVATERGQVVERGYIVASLSGAIRDGDHGLKLVPGLLKRVCNEQCWRERYVEVIQQVVSFETFVEFVEKHPPEGLGVDLDTLKKLCRDDVEAIDIIDRETKRPRGFHILRDDNNGNITESSRPVGNTADYALRKLREDAPSLHREVIEGRKSPHAAMVEAGFRRKTVTVPVDPERAAKTLSRHFTPDELRALVSELSALLDWRP